MSTKDEQAQDVPCVLTVTRGHTGSDAFSVQPDPSPFVRIISGYAEVTGWHIARFREECQKAGRELSFPVWWFMWGCSLRAPLWYRIRRWFRRYLHPHRAAE